MFLIYILIKFGVHIKITNNDMYYQLHNIIGNSL